MLWYSKVYKPESFIEIMEIESELFKQNPWWEDKFEEKSFPRERYLKQLTGNLKNKEIIFLTGLRRIGKTTIQPCVHIISYF
jgi:predicted AAA+ superfamily ATPase